MMVVGTTLFIGMIPFLIPVGFACIDIARIQFKRNQLLRSVDHEAVRDAGRQLLSQYPGGSTVPTSCLPEALRTLNPSSAYINERGFLILELGSGVFRHGFLIGSGDVAYTNEADPFRSWRTLIPLAAGIWYYEADAVPL